MSKLFTLLLLLSLSMQVFGQIPGAGFSRDFQPREIPLPPRFQPPPQIIVPVDADIIKAWREQERRREIPGTEQRKYIIIEVREPNARIENPLNSLKLSIAKIIAEQIATKNYDRLYFGKIEEKKGQQLLDGQVDVSIELNADGRVQLAMVNNYPKNESKRKFAEDAVRMIHRSSPYSISLSTQKITVDLTFMFNDKGLFKIQPKEILVVPK